MKSTSAFIQVTGLLLILFSISLFLEGLGVTDIEFVNNDSKAALFGSSLVVLTIGGALIEYES